MIKKVIFTLSLLFGMVGSLAAVPFTTTYVVQESTASLTEVKQVCQKLDDLEVKSQEDAFLEWKTGTLIIEKVDSSTYRVSTIGGGQIAIVVIGD